MARWKPLVFAACLLPLVILGYRTYANELGPNPVETLTHGTGEWALRMLLLCLAVTPLRRLLKRSDLAVYRRMLGLFAFFYASLHVLVWILFDHGFGVAAAIDDVAKRPFITAGAASFLLMLPLAMTSTAGAIRRLGGAQWRALHRLVYVAGLAAVVHYYWLVKSDISEPVAYAGILLMLLLARVAFYVRSTR